MNKYYKGEDTPGGILKLVKIQLKLSFIWLIFHILPSWEIVSQGLR